MHRLLAISGSLRAESSNTGLMRMAARLAPAELAFDIYDGLADLPYYDADLDGPESLPESVRQWRQAVTDADAVFLAAPEYNWGPTAVMKNGLDWASRPLGAHSLQGKVVAVVSSGGGGGGRRVQAYLAEILGLLGNTMVMEPPIAVEKGAKVIAADGTTTDPELEARMAQRLGLVVTALHAR